MTCFFGCCNLIDGEHPIRLGDMYGGLLSSSLLGLLRALGEHPREDVGIAAAAEGERLPAEVSDAILSRLLAERSVSVRKFAVNNVSQVSGRKFQAVLDQVASAASEPVLRSTGAEPDGGLRPEVVTTRTTTSARCHPLPGVRRAAPEEAW